MRHLGRPLGDIEEGMKDNRKGICPKCKERTSAKRVKKYGQCEICWNEERIRSAQGWPEGGADPIRHETRGF